MIVEYLGAKNPLKYFERWWILHLRGGGARIGLGISLPQNLEVESQTYESCPKISVQQDLNYKAL